MRMKSTNVSLHNRRKITGSLATVSLTTYYQRFQMSEI